MTFNEKHILVHLHLYYHEQIDYMISKLKNITNCNWDLYVTVCEENEETNKKILDFKPEAKILMVENNGYDVLPFIRVIKSINLEDYDYILKIHTKNFQEKPNALGKKGFWWRDELIDVLLKSKNRFKHNLKILQKKEYGIICSALMFRTISGNKDIPEESDFFNFEFERLKFTTKDRNFCAGTMFIAKADIFKFLQSEKIQADDFKTTQTTSSKGSLAHVYERILCVAASESGYKIFPKVNKVEIINLLNSKRLEKPDFYFLKNFIFSINIENFNNKIYKVLTILGYKFKLYRDFFAEKMKNKEAVPICLASDNNYMPYTYITIKSVLNNKNINTKYKFIILHSNDISSFHKLNLNKLVQNNLCEIEYIDMKENFKEIKMQIPHITMATFYRLLLPNLLKEYNKCIWLDGDIVVQKDLKKLFDTDINSYYFAGVRAPYAVVDEEYHKILEIPSMDYYINAGVVLWNLKLLRQEGVVDKFISLLPKNFLMQDQDIMNAACYHKIKILPLKYNLMTKSIILKQTLIDKKVCSKKEFLEAVLNPEIIHYVSGRKPWNSDCHYYKIWWKYASRTPYYYDLKMRFNYIQKSQGKLSSLQKIFSIKNDKRGTHKIITILGLKLKIKRQNINYRRRKILLISHAFTTDGAPSSLLSVSKILSSNNNITVWSIKDGPMSDVYRKELNVKPTIIDISNIEFIKKEIQKYDFVYINTVVTYKFAQICEELGIPYMWVIREASNIPQICKDFKIDLNELKSIIKKSQKSIYSVSEYAKKYINETFGVNISVIKNFIEDSFKKEPTFNSNNLVFTVMGCHESRKGVHVLIDAIKQQEKPCILNICGNSSTEYAKNLIDSTANDKNIIWKEIVRGSDKEKIFGETDVFVVPSLDESCSRVVLESMMMGKPVIVTENVGAKYMVNKKTGWIVKTGDVSSLSDCIRQILSNTSVLQKKGGASRIMYLKTSTPAIYCKKLYKIVSSKTNKRKFSIETIFSIKNEPIRKQHKIITILGLKIKIKKKEYSEYSLLERIFSVKNHESKNNNWYKVISILGVKFSFKNKELTQRKNLIKTASLVEEQTLNANKQYNALKEQNNSLYKLLNDVKKNCNCIQEQNNDLKKQNSLLIKLVGDAEKNYNDIQEQNNDLKKQNNLLIKLVGDVEKNYNDIQEQKYALDEQNNVLKEQNNALIQLVCGIQESTFELQSQNDKLFQLLQEIQTNECVAYEKNQKLTNEVDSLTNQIKTQQLQSEKLKQDLNKKIDSARKQIMYKVDKYIPDEKRIEALKDWYFEKTGEVLNLENPKSFNEKIQWLKLYDSSPIKTQLSDKYLVRDWVKEKIGEKYLIPLLGVYDNFDEIDFDKLPNQFVIKCNHGSGYNIIVADKSAFNKEDAKKKINTWLNEDYSFRLGFELHYANIPRKIIIEEYIDPKTSNIELQSWCFGGELKFISYETCKDVKNAHRAIFSPDWEYQDFMISPQKYSKFPEIPQRPEYLEELKNIVSILCKDMKHVRIDFAVCDGKLIFREMTFTSGSGASKFSPDEMKYKLGEMITIDKK